MTAGFTVPKKQVEWLSWKGYSEKQRISLAGWREGFALPARYLERVPYCIESYAYLRDLDSQDRVTQQHYLIDSTHHSVMSSIYLGIMRQKDMAWLKSELQKCLMTVLKLAQLTALEDLQGETVARLLSSMKSANSAYFRSALESSLYYYASGKQRSPFERVLDLPLYVELGTDILTSGTSFALAEFQVRYATPYPHLLAHMDSAYRKLLPALFQTFGLKEETFPDRRLKMLSKTMEQFSALSSESPARVLLDAWAYLENAGCNWKELAAQLDAQYVLFDDLLKTQNIHEKSYRNRRLAIFNQPPLNLIDASDHLFEKVNSEMLENYDELGWVGLLERYLGGQVFLANSPVSDIMNDKALYTFLPELSQLFFGETIDLPVVETKPCWLLDDFSQPNLDNLELARRNKDDYVIAHRYLEGGMGIRVGHVTSEEEWNSFIETFVVDRPYLYVLRNRFEMDPDMSVRILSSMNLPNHRADVATQAEVEIMDSLYARLTTDPPLGTDNHRSFLIYEASADRPQPRYQFEEDSVR